MGLAQSLLNKTYGRLTVTAAAGANKRGRNWECLCSCGNKLVTCTVDLNRGSITSCGCSKKERLSKLNRKPAGEAAKNRLLKSYQRGAERRKLKFALTKEQFEDLTQSDCYYCGIAPSTSTQAINPTGSSQILYNGVDRKDNDVGYEVSNCVPCCKNCNMAKFEFTYEEFLAYIKRLVDFNAAKNCSNK